MIISSYCYGDNILCSMDDGYVYLLDKQGKIIKSYLVAIRNLDYPFFNLDVSMKNDIIISSYSANFILTGKLTDLNVKKSNFKFSFNQIIRYSKDSCFYAATTNNTIVKLNISDLSYEIIQKTETETEINDDYIYPGHIQEYTGKSGPFFKKNEIYVSWKNGEGIGYHVGITSIHNHDIYQGINFTSFCFCGNNLFGIMHDIDSTVLLIIDCTNDKIIGKLCIAGKKEDIYPFPNVNSDHKNNVILEYKNTTYILNKNCYNNIDKCYKVIKGYPVICGKDVKLIHYDKNNDKFSIETIKSRRTLF